MREPPCERRSCRCERSLVSGPDCLFGFFFLAAASSSTRGDHLGEPFVSAISRATAEQVWSNDDCLDQRELSSWLINGACFVFVLRIVHVLFSLLSFEWRDFLSCFISICVYILSVRNMFAINEHRLHKRDKMAIYSNERKIRECLQLSATLIIICVSIFCVSPTH